MPERKRSETEVFTEALMAHAGRFCVSLRAQDAALLRKYFAVVNGWNARLHLVAPCRPSEFATRHVLESLTALAFLSEGARVIDIGSGAGLPMIPCLIVRPDLEAVLVESSQKKAVFLREALRQVERRQAARVVAERFENIPPPDADFITCRALERFTEILPSLIEWATAVKTFLLFGGSALREKIESLSLPYKVSLMPDSEKRYLYVVERKPKMTSPGEAHRSVEL